MIKELKKGLTILQPNSHTSLRCIAAYADVLQYCLRRLQRLHAHQQIRKHLLEQVGLHRGLERGGAEWGWWKGGDEGRSGLGGLVVAMHVKFGALSQPDPSTEQYGHEQAIEPHNGYLGLCQVRGSNVACLKKTSCNKKSSAGCSGSCVSASPCRNLVR